MPFIPKTQAQLDAMTPKQLGAYKAIVEGIFTQVRETVLLEPHIPGSPCPKAWLDCVYEINAITMTIINKMMGAFPHGGDLREVRKMLHQDDPNQGE